MSRAVLPASLAALAIACSGGPPHPFAKSSAAYEAWLRTPEPPSALDLPPGGCLPTLPSLNLRPGISFPPPPPERALAPDTIVLQDAFFHQDVRPPALSAGVLRIHSHVIAPAPVDASQCMLSVHWDGDARGETAPAPPDEVGHSSRESRTSSATWKREIPIAANDDAVLRVSGLLRCPGIERRWGSYVAGPGALPRYCALCSAERQRLAEEVGGDVGDATSILVVRRGIAGRIRQGVLVDACDGRFLLDLAGSGIHGVELSASSDAGRVETETKAVYDALRWPSMCADVPFVPGDFFLEGKPHPPAAERARLVALLRTVPGIFQVQGPRPPRSARVE